MNGYCYEAEAYDHEFQRYADFDGTFTMESLAESGRSTCSRRQVRHGKLWQHWG